MGMMTPTRKSGRQPKPSTKLKEFLYDKSGDVEKSKSKEPASRGVDKKKPQAVKEPASRAAVKKKISPVKKKPVGRATEKQKAPPATKQTAARVPLKKKTVQIKEEPGSQVTEKQKAPPATKQTAARVPVKKKTVQIKEEPGTEKQKVPQNTKKTTASVPEKKKVPVTASVPEKKKTPVAASVPEKKKTPVAASVPEKKKTPVAASVPEKKKTSAQNKEEPASRAEKRKISQVTKDVSDSATPSRKSRRTPKPSFKLDEFIYDDEREKSVESVIREIEKPKRPIKIKEEFDTDDEDDDDVEEEEEEEGEEFSDSSDSYGQVGKRERSPPVSTSGKNRKISVVTSPRARVTSLTSITAKKERNALNASRQVQKKVKPSISSSDNSSATHKKIITKKTVPAAKEKVSLIKKRPREPENLPKTNRKFTKDKETAKPKVKGRPLNERNEKTKQNKPEKMEIEKVLQVNKEVMTQLLNFGAEVAEAMACNNESIFSFSTKDNPLQTFKIDKQDDFSEEEVVKIIKWFEEEEDQRRAYRKRILEALRASHETNMSLYTQMLKMLQSVTAY